MTICPVASACNGERVGAGVAGGREAGGDTGIVGVESTVSSSVDVPVGVAVAGVLIGEGDGVEVGVLDVQDTGEGDGVTVGENVGEGETVPVGEGVVVGKVGGVGEGGNGCC